MIVYKTIDELHSALRESVVKSIKNKLYDMCVKVVREFVVKNVYESYVPSESGYDRTFELLNSVSIRNLSVGKKYLTFEVFMDTNKIQGYVTSDRSEWNRHANIWGGDESEFIPLWIEEGTENSLFDRPPAYYMQDSTMKLDNELYKALGSELRRDGWKVSYF